MRWMMRKLSSAMVVAVALAAGLAATQAPLFVGHYLQRLGGHLDEALLFQRYLAESGVLESLDAVARNALGDAMAARVAALGAARDAIAGAGFITRPWVFLAHMDQDIAAATLAQFRPALPLDAAALAYGGVAMVLVWLAAAPFFLVRRRRHA